MELNRGTTPNSDCIAAAGIQCGGTLTVTNLGARLSVGDTFILLSGPISGSFGAVNLPATDASGATYTWDNRIETDGTIRVLTAQGGINPVPTNIVFQASGTSLTLSWPADHLGWVLQAQTNAPILGSTLGVENTYGALEGRAAQGLLTFGRISTADHEGRIRSYVGDGELTGDPLDTFGNRAVAHVPQLQIDIRKLKWDAWLAAVRRIL